MENTIKNTSDDKHKIVEKYFDMIYKLALSQAKDSYVAEDVTADVFLKYIESSKAFKSEEHIKAWLIRVTINRVKCVFTSSWNKKTGPLLETIGAQMIEEESEVYQAVLTLPQKYRLVVHLFYYEGLKTAEIAKYLKIKEATVRSQLLRARQLLKITLEGENEYV